MKFLRLAPLASLALLWPTIGCQQVGSTPRPASSAPATPAGTQAAAPAGGTTEPMSLAAALREQEQVEARSLSTKLGIRLEDRPSGATPEWFAAAATTQGRSAGVASARTLVEAVNQAVTKAGRQIEARGGRPQSMKIERVAYARLATGVYSAWAAMGDGSNMGDVVATAEEPVIEITSPQVPMPSLRDPKAAIATGESATPPAPTPTATPAPAPTPTPAPAPEATPAVPDPVATPAPDAPATPAVDAPAVEATKPSEPAAPAAAAMPETAAPSLPGAGLDTLLATEPPLKAPSWWNATPMQQGGRVVVGVMVEGRTTGECIAAARRTARTKLAAAIGEEPGPIVAQRTLVSGAKGNMLRMFATMSCKGTLVPPAEQTPADVAK